ncbi:MAG: hypothetical protein ABEN55_21095 [Bradymonadaceae bacterium]
MNTDDFKVTYHCGETGILDANYDDWQDQIEEAVDEHLGEVRYADCPSNTRRFDEPFKEIERFVQYELLEPFAERARHMGRPDDEWTDWNAIDWDFDVRLPDGYDRNIDYFQNYPYVLGDDLNTFFVMFWNKDLLEWIRSYHEDVSRNLEKKGREGSGFTEMSGETFDLHIRDIWEAGQYIHNQHILDEDKNYLI